MNIDGLNEEQATLLKMAMVGATNAKRVLGHVSPVLLRVVGTDLETILLGGINKDTVMEAIKAVFEMVKEAKLAAFVTEAAKPSPGLKISLFLNQPCERLIELWADLQEDGSIAPWRVLTDRNAKQLKTDQKAKAQVKSSQGFDFSSGGNARLN